MTTRALVSRVLIVSLLSAVGAVQEARAQGGRGRAAAQAGVSPAELQRLFDAYVVMNAQQELQLTDQQFPQFLTRVRELQAVRRRTQVERTRLLQELRRLSAGGEQRVDEPIAQRVRELDDLDARAAGEVRSALERVDEILEPRQRARFRLFEQQMERRKVELLLRARQGGRANRF